MVVNCYGFYICIIGFGGGFLFVVMRGIGIIIDIEFVIKDVFDGNDICFGGECG